MEHAVVAAARDLPADNAAANVDYVRRMVKLEPKAPSLAASPPKPELKGTAATDAPAEGASGWAPQVATAKR